MSGGGRLAALGFEPAGEVPGALPQGPSYADVLDAFCESGLRHAVREAGDKRAARRLASGLQQRIAEGNPRWGRRPHRWPGVTAHLRGTAVYLSRDPGVGE